MKCLLCKQAETRPGQASVTLERNGSTAVIDAVPVQLCPACGEAYTDEATAARLLTLAEELVAGGEALAAGSYTAG